MSTAWPPIVPPPGRANADNQLDTHPLDHNQIANSLASIVAKVDAAGNATGGWPDMQKLTVGTSWDTLTTFARYWVSDPSQGTNHPPNVPGVWKGVLEIVPASDVSGASYATQRCVLWDPAAATLASQVWTRAGYYAGTGSWKWSAWTRNNGPLLISPTLTAVSAAAGVTQTAATFAMPIGSGSRWALVRYLSLVSVTPDPVIQLKLLNGSTVLGTRTFYPVANGTSISFDFVTNLTGAAVTLTLTLGNSGSGAFNNYLDPTNHNGSALIIPA